ncbi:glutathione transferase GstA [Niveibacterium sp. SC-1]|uniref:glutathione transferase GstA n=1 Tax=Niveibacterium sp. SC-1 TaxID=3135646 RepID=UPI003120232A
MKLYYSPGACSLAPHIVLRETGQTADLVRVDLATHRTEDGRDFMEINPKGQVPLLELDDGRRLSEGAVIAQYLGDRVDNPSLMPRPGTDERYRLLEWQTFITTELHKSFTPLFNAALDADAKRVLSQILLKKLQWVDTQLAERRHLLGEAFSAADAYLFVVCGWARFVGLSIQGLSHLQRFLAEVGARPAVREALAAEGLLAA